MKKILITGAGGPLGVNVTRSLKRAPEILFLVGTECNKYHLNLALTDKIEHVPHASLGDVYIDKMKQVVDKYEIDLIFPTHPLEVLVLGKSRQAFKCNFFLPEQKTIETGNDKYDSFKIWDEKGISVPDTILIENENVLHEAFSRISGKPIWVRGRGTPGLGMGAKALPCKNEEEAKFWIEYWKGWGHFIASEFLPGDNMTWLSLWKDGNLMTSQGRIRLEYVIPHVSQSGVTGAPAVSKTVKSKGLNELGEKAVNALDNKPNGVYFIDFKKDHSGNLKITEINPGRFGTTIHFYTEAGVNFPHLYVKLAFGENIGGVPKYDPLREGLFWLRTLDCGPVLIAEEDLKL